MALYAPRWTRPIHSVGAIRSSGRMEQPTSSSIHRVGSIVSQGH